MNMNILSSRHDILSGSNNLTIMTSMIITLILQHHHDLIPLVSNLSQARMSQPGPTLGVVARANRSLGVVARANHSTESRKTDSEASQVCHHERPLQHTNPTGKRFRGGEGERRGGGPNRASRGTFNRHLSRRHFILDYLHLSREHTWVRPRRCSTGCPVRIWAEPLS